MTLATQSPLKTELAGLQLATPILNASGAFNASLFSQLFSLKNTLGAVVTKTVTREPWAGNSQHRTVELAGVGMLNSIGLQNPGLISCLESEVPALNAEQVPVILSISAHSAGEFAEMAAWVTGHVNGNRVAAFELNLSCPNVEKGGIEFGSTPSLITEAVAAVVAATNKPVFAKLTPNVASIVPMAAAALEGGAAGLTAINTVLGAAIDVKRKTTILPRVSGGYSGPGIKPIALHHIIQLYKHFPEAIIIAVGGISSAEDVLEFLMAGATAVQIGTACFRHPKLFEQIAKELTAYCQQENLSSLSTLRGCALL